MATRTPQRLYVRAAFINEVRDIIERWSGRRLNRSSVVTRRASIERDRAACLRHLGALRALVAPLPARLPPREQRAAVAALDSLEASLSSSGRWDLLKRKLPPHRPSEKDVRDALRLAMKRYQVDATTTAKVIVSRITPSLPADARAALLGSWRHSEPDSEKRDQIRYLAEKWLRRTR